MVEIVEKELGDMKESKPSEEASEVTKGSKGCRKLVGLVDKNSQKDTRVVGVGGLESDVERLEVVVGEWNT